MQELCAQDSKVGYSEEIFKLRYGGVEKGTSYDISSWQNWFTSSSYETTISGL